MRRLAVLPVNGALHVAERFAIDFVQMNPQRLLVSGPLDAFSSYPYFGDTVHSATAGRVVGVVDDLPETTPGSFPAGITAAEAGGNHVVMDGPGPLASNGLPYRFTRFRVDGTVTNFDAFQAGQPAAIGAAPSGVHRRELPMNLEVIGFD